MNLDGVDMARFDAEVLTPGDWGRLGVADRWILHRCAKMVDTVHAELSAWRLDLAANRAYQFVWHELCDWYLELAKPSLRTDADPEARFAAQGTLALVLDLALRALHPFIPFVTEEIWQHLPGRVRDAESLMLAAYPEVCEDGTVRGPTARLAELRTAETFQAAAEDIALLESIVHRRRNLAAESRVPPSKRVSLLLRPASDAGWAQIVRIEPSLRAVGRVDAVTRLEDGAALPAGSAVAVVGDLEVILPLEGLVDLAEERKRLVKEIAKKEKDLIGLERKLQNQGFISKAPPEVVESERARLVTLQTTLEKQRGLLATLGSDGT